MESDLPKTELVSLEARKQSESANSPTEPFDELSLPSWVDYS